MHLSADPMQIAGAAIFAIALLHTFLARHFEHLAHLSPSHAGLFHLLGEVEVVFGFWAFVLIACMAVMQGSHSAIEYAESRQYTEPLFVFVVMVVAGSRPVIALMNTLLSALARVMPIRTELAFAWLGLAVVPLLGSLVTEPAAMTLAALLLSARIFVSSTPERVKYAALGTLFVNVSIGGTLTSYAAPPVLMVATTWNWDSAFMFSHFGWKACVAVLANASIWTAWAHRHISAQPEKLKEDSEKVPLGISVVHIALLALIVTLAHHVVLFMGIFLLFLGFTQAYSRHQSPLLLKEGLLVGFFLAGLVILGGVQQWWLQPLVSSLAPASLFAGALFLTAITDNAALTYLGSLIDGLPEAGRYMLMAGAVAGGGLTVIANAPNPAGVALLRAGFEDSAVGVGGLLLGAALPTIVASACLLLL